MIYINTCTCISFACKYLQSSGKFSNNLQLTLKVTIMCVLNMLNTVEVSVVIYMEIFIVLVCTVL